MKSLINGVTNTTTGWDSLPLRVGAGAIFAAHGAQELFSCFGLVGGQCHPGACCADV